MSSYHQSPHECNVCQETNEVMIKCDRCVYYLCSDCMSRVDKCPYCRLQYPQRRSPSPVSSSSAFPVESPFARRMRQAILSPSLPLRPPPLERQNAILIISSSDEEEEDNDDVIMMISRNRRSEGLVRD